MLRRIRIVFYCSLVICFSSVAAKEFEIFSANRAVIGQLDLVVSHSEDRQVTQYYYACCDHEHPRPTIPEVASCNAMCVGISDGYLSIETAMYCCNQAQGHGASFSFISHDAEHRMFWGFDSRLVLATTFQNNIELKKEESEHPEPIERLWKVLWATFSNQISAQCCARRYVLNRTLLGFYLQYIDSVQRTVTKENIKIELHLTNTLGESLYICFIFQSWQLRCQISRMPEYLLGINLFTPLPNENRRRLLAYLRPRK